MMSLARWRQPWDELGLAVRMELHAELRNRYSERHRAYHSLRHINECLKLLEQTQHLAVSSASVEIALWFHDAIYDPRRSDNEERSAQWARYEIRQAGGSHDLQEHISELVMITAHGEASLSPQTPDEELISDIDLGILGAGPVRYDEFEKQVKVEYRHVPSRQFRDARRKVVSGFLERERIYFTPWFRERREVQARVNLQRAMTRLSGNFW